MCLLAGLAPMIGPLVDCSALCSVNLGSIPSTNTSSRIAETDVPGQNHASPQRADGDILLPSAQTPKPFFHERNIHVTLSEEKEAPLATAYERYRAQHLANSQFRLLYDRKRDHIDAIDWILSAVDERRVAMGLTKADLARLVGRKPESVRRLFSAQTANPTLSTVLDMAFVLGLELRVIPTVSVDDLAPQVQKAAHELAGQAS